MLIFATVSLPPRSRAISSSAGAIILHGPHHSAQKSTSTGPAAFRTSASNEASLTWMVWEWVVVAVAAAVIPVFLAWVAGPEGDRRPPVWLPHSILASGPDGAKGRTLAFESRAPYAAVKAGVSAMRVQHILWDFHQPGSFGPQQETANFPAAIKACQGRAIGRQLPHILL